MSFEPAHRHIRTQHTRNTWCNLPCPSDSYSIFTSRVVLQLLMFTLTYILQLLMLHTRRYDKAKVPVPHFTAGTDVAFNITLTIDHGGQVVAPSLLPSFLFLFVFFLFSFEHILFPGVDDVRVCRKHLGNE